MTLTMAHANFAKLENGVFKVDRKFHVGMQMYAEKIRAPLVTVHPELPSGGIMMDTIEVPCATLGYQAMTVKVDAAVRPLPHEMPRLRDQIAASQLVYGGSLGTPQIAQEVGAPYILILEYDLLTQIVFTTTQVSSVVRRASRAARAVWHYATVGIPEMRRAHSLHCNGYPIYEATQKYNKRALLYLDSRMSRDMIISDEELATRLASRARRPLRLLFSGRYERMKGVDDAAKVAVECLRRGLDIEMHFYGQGALQGDLERIAAEAPRPGRIYIHTAIPYPELVKISRTFDLFVCCHIQNDPSCTYLESFGAGLPIVGYGNRMWRRLREVSEAGYDSPVGRPDSVADDVQRLAQDFNTLSSMSVRAAAFARQHSWEQEFDKRVSELNSVVA